MIAKNNRLAFITCLTGVIILLSGFAFQSSTKKPFKFPYAKAGLTDRQAAAHLLSRFTYGATPGQVDSIISIGIENWFQLQLQAGIPDEKLNALLNGYDILKLSNTEIANTYKKGGQVLRMAIADGTLNKDSVNKADKKAYQEQLADYMQDKGFKPERELMNQFINQKIWRAAYTNNQLQEVMTAFWFNHFNVSVTKNGCSQFIPNYERDAVRPHALGKFEDLLLATAKSPAMLLYLDNFSSEGANDHIDSKPNKNKNKDKKLKGLNENYAREVMELHTLGVDGGYTQTDVTEAARILTGWTIYPMANDSYGNGYLKLLEKSSEEQLAARGFIHEGDFLFTPNRHDNQPKIVLGKHFHASQGYDEGIDLLKLLASHPSTAKFISTKLARRFVSDEPPASLIQKMEKTFLKKHGDIKEILITMVSSPEFWEEPARRAKTKSPFELTISSVRALNASIEQPHQLFLWIKRMGEPLYAFADPTGFPDRGQYWINTGSLLSRMNFGLAVANGKIQGVTFDLLGLNQNKEPESAEAALETFSKILLPERNTNETVKRLEPLVNDPELQNKVNDASAKADKSSDEMSAQDSLNDNSGTAKGKESKASKAPEKYRLAQVVGILLGSPEFQRR